MTPIRGYTKQFVLVVMQCRPLRVFAARGSILERSALTRFHARSSIEQLHVNNANVLRHHYIIDSPYIKSQKRTISHLLNHNTQSIMSFDQENQGSRRNFNDDANYDSPSGDQRTVPGGDTTLSGSHGGSGSGQAGGYTGSERRAGRQGQQGLDEGDEYCDTDPGMAGNRGAQDVNIPGVGGENDSAYGQSIGGDGRSRGYERDTDEYDDSGIGSGQGQGTGRGPTGKLSSMSSKLMGWSFFIWIRNYTHLSVQAEWRRWLENFLMTPNARPRASSARYVVIYCCSGWDGL
ncbi:hypothetical protein DEU56DRAFT_835086 [Suillus clintonianus]|uniref:uncharacterized protein n=1 Tax=Suillus clintonianus TaxID=1904413 RepID=UPI001B870560|nr:uncharacterized protein DEU56DRAFT_835086 [Suillus clintonianus]KAG2121089.1 hypothetical protein DEU56DRAFT_835086 [Suillus clintonianus]